MAVHVDDHDAVALQVQGHSEVEGGGGLAYTALVVADADDGTQLRLAFGFHNKKCLWGTPRLL